jgi:hypothetical protein
MRMKQPMRPVWQNCKIASGLQLIGSYQERAASHKLRFANQRILISERLALIIILKTGLGADNCQHTRQLALPGGLQWPCHLLVTYSIMRGACVAK